MPRCLHWQRLHGIIYLLQTSTSLSSHYWIRWRLLHISSAEVRSTVRLLYPIPHKSHPVEARSFERRSSKEGSPGGLSWPRARLDAHEHERFPNGLAVDFWYDMLQSLHVFTLRPPRDRRGVEEWCPCHDCDSIGGDHRVVSGSRWRDLPAPIRCVVHNGWAQAVVAAVGKYRDPGSLLQWVDAWSLRDIDLCILP